MNLSSNYEVEGQMTIFDWLGPDTWCGKTSPEPLAVTEEKTSVPSLKKQRVSRTKMPLYLELRRSGQMPVASWETGGALHGVYMMHSFGESPKDVVESRLSQILEEKPLQKYSLSAKACQGILRRAEKRGKTLPEMLKNALIEQSASLNVAENLGGVKESLSSKEEQAPCQPLTINQSCQEPILLESNQNHATIQTDGVSTALPASMGMGGGYVPMVARSITARNDGSPCVDRGPDVVCYGISSYESNSMKSDNPNAGIYEAETSRTLDLNGGSPACNQGGIAVVSIEGNGSRPSHKGDGFSESETMYTLNSTEHHAVCASQNAYDKYEETEKGASIKASGGNYGGGYREHSDTVGALCARDFKGVGSQYVGEGKCIVQDIP